MSFTIYISVIIVICSLVYYKYYFYSKKNVINSVPIINENSNIHKSLLKEPNNINELIDWCVGVLKNKKEMVQSEIENNGLIIKSMMDFGPHSKYIFYTINSDYNTIIKLFNVAGVNTIVRNHVEGE